MFEKLVNRKRVIIAAILLVAVAAAVITNVALKSYLLESNVSQLKFQNGVEYDTVAFGKEVLVVNNEGILALSRAGREMWHIVCAATSPTVDINEKYIMLADMNGKDVNLFKEDRLITQIKTEKEILSAKLNKNGYIAVATSDLGYKGMITVYDKSGNETFKWHSGSGYIGGMDISSNDKIAVAQIMTDKNRVYSKIISINMKKNGEVTEIAEHEGIVMEISFRDNGTFTAVSESGVYGFSKGGKEVYNISFGGRIMQNYDIKNENNMVFAFDNGRNGTVLESYSSKGKCRGVYDAEVEVRSFDVNGECIAIGTSDKVLRVTPTGKLKKEIKFTHDVKNIEIFGNRDRLIVIGGNSAELIKI